MRTAISWLDVKLGLRMLARSPGLSLAGAFAIAMVVACGVAVGVFDAVVNGTLPFPEGERVVAIENWDAKANEARPPTSYDFASWRDALASIEDVGAYRIVNRNVGAAGTAPEAVRIAEISAAAFRVARVPPLLGRYLVADDELASSPPVIVIGYTEWQRRFSGDPQVLGRTILVGDTTFTVVGVMPEGFGFPIRERGWIPLRLDPAGYLPGQGPELSVFGRLADSFDRAAAEAELTVVGERSAADLPATYAGVRPRVLPFTKWFFVAMQDRETQLFQLVVALLLGIVGANVAVLVYARTATRLREIAIRSALGASRARIVGQMFAEGLVLSALAAAVGLLIAGVIRTQFLRTLIAQAPFWVDTSLTSGTVISYVVVLIVLGAVIVGVVPGLQATGRRVQPGLRTAAAPVSRWKVGRTYGALIVVQIALAVAILPLALSTAWVAIQNAMTEPGFAAQEFLAAGVTLDRTTEVTDAAFAARFRDRQAELVRRLDAEPGIAEVTMLTRVGDNPTVVIEVEGAGLTEASVGGMGADFGEIGVDYLRTFGVPVLAGRTFAAADAGSASRPVIVNRTFAERLLGGNAVGRRIRERRGSDTQEFGPWLEIVGVVGDFPATPVNSSAEEATLYHPVARGELPTVLVAFRFSGGSSAEFANRLRETAAAVDRDLQLFRVNPMATYLRMQQIELEIVAWSFGLLTLSVLLLSGTGFYALMAFTVTQRRREIGIRVALGGKPHRIMRAIMSRAFWQLAIGIALGSGAAWLFHLGDPRDLASGSGFGILASVALFVLLIGLIAAGAPAWRGVRVQPTEVLREE